MKHKIRIITAALLILTVFSFAVYAEAVSEKTSDFGSLDFETASFETVMSSYEDAVSLYKSQYESIYSKMEEAYSKNNADDYFDAKAMLRSLEYPVITAEQTETLVSRLLAEEEGEAKNAFSSWLYSNSRYYSPALTFSREVETNEDCYSYFSYRYSISTEPGKTVTLPAVGSSDLSDGVFAGWGTMPDRVEYEAGSEIAMPYTDQTLYAVYKKGVRFSDTVTSTEVFNDGDEVSAPELTAPDESYVFMGWYDAKGNKADGLAKMESGKSASYTAKWKSVKVSDIYVRYYKDMAVPAGTQVKLGFTVANQGNMNTGSISVELVPEDENSLKVLTGTLYSRNLGEELSKTGSFTVVANGDSGSAVNANIVVTDSDGNVWKTPVTLTIK